MNESVFNSKQEQNYNECRSECEKLDWSSCRDDYMLNACTCMVAEMDHRQNTFNMFRLLMKLKRHLMSVEFLQVQLSSINIFKDNDLVWLKFSNHI